MTGGDPRARGTGVAVLVALASVTLSAVPRLMLSAGALPDVARPFIWSDVYATYLDLLRHGELPYFGTFFDYPPLIGYVAGLFATLTRSPVAYLALWTALLGAAAAVIARLVASGAGPRRALLFWSLSPQLLLYGAANFDLIPVACTAAAAAAARRGRWLAPALLLALGTLAKLFPATVALAFIERLRRASRTTVAALAGATFLLVVVVLAAPAMLAPHPALEGILVQGARTNFDSVWGLAHAALGAAGAPADAIVGVASLAGFGATFLVVLRHASADPARVALLSVLAVLLWTRLYSPQYSLWLLPLFALCDLRPRPFVLLAGADIAVFLTVYPLTLVPWSTSEGLPTILFGVLAAAVVLRHLALIWLWRSALRS